MPIISIAATYPIAYGSKADTTHGSSDEVSFVVSPDGQPTTVTIIGNERYARALIQDIAVSDALFEWIESAPKLVAAYPTALAEDIKGIVTKLENAARMVVEAVKYLLSRPDMPDNVLGMAADFYCIDALSKKHSIPTLPSGYMTGYSQLPLEGSHVVDLQAGLKLGYRPLAGMRHLFRAMQESEPRFRWIDITIALELAIKEALIRKRPEIETLLLEMPSPPLDKLYGPIMKEAFGAASPHLKAIRDGVAKRNKLVHRPVGVVISKDEAASYLYEAHKAINHLFSLLYPDWPIAKNMSSMIYHG